MCSSFGARAKRSRRAMTLVELLLVIAILIILFGLTMSAVQMARAAAWRAGCGNNLRQIGIALHGYHDANKTLPLGMSRRPNQKPYLAWSARILPYLEQAPLWQATEKAFATTRPFSDNPPHIGLATPLAIYLCPTEDHTIGSDLPEITKAAVTNYFGVSSGVRWYDGVLFPESQVKMSEITDGLSTTLMVGERGMGVDGNGEYRFGWWYGGVGQLHDGSADYLLGVRENRTTYRTPTCSKSANHFGPGRSDNPCDLFHHWSLHPGGAHFLFADGSVRFLTYSADSILPALATRAGGETVTVPD